MNRLAPIGRVFFAVSLIAFAIQQFLFGDFVPGRAPEWPASLPGRLVWAYFSGAIFIACGLAILLGKRARPAAMLAGTMIFAWAFLRNIPVALADRMYGGAWTNLGKGLAFFGGAYAVAGSLPREKPAFLHLGRWCLGAFLVSSGIQHFLFVPFVATLVPAWIPGPVFWTCFAGVALIAGGAGLVVPATARWAAAASGLMVFLWVVMLHVPRAVAAAAGQGRNEWTAVFEALAISGIAFVLTRTLPPE
jgi:uncharacterized membrane protein YphA (DoxX/SURF4 family)